MARYEEALVGSGGSAPAADPATTAAPAKDDDEVSMDAGDDLEDAPVSDGEDEPSAKKPKADPAQPVSSQNPSKRELEKQRKASGACLFCGSTDHKGNECPERVASLFCHICGDKGHRHAECHARKKDVAENACLLCGDARHVVFKCPDKKIDPDRAERPPRESDGRGLTCSICRKQGHVRRDCPEKGDDTRAPREQWCFVCGTVAKHKRFECPSAVKTSDKNGCFVCGASSHRAVACPDKKLDPDAKCGTCGKPGHERRECPDKPAEDVSKMFCFICGEVGHKRQECPKRVPEADVPENGCIICGDSAHSMHKYPLGKCG